MNTTALGQSFGCTMTLRKKTVFPPIFVIISELLWAYFTPEHTQNFAYLPVIRMQMKITPESC